MPCTGKSSLGKTIDFFSIYRFSKTSGGINWNLKRNCLMGAENVLELRSRRSEKKSMPHLFYKSSGKRSRGIDQQGVCREIFLASRSIYIDIKQSFLPSDIHGCIFLRIELLNLPMRQLFWSLRTRPRCPSHTASPMDCVNREWAQGLRGMSTLLVAAESQKVLGLIGQEAWLLETKKNTLEKWGGRKGRMKRSYQEKEAHRPIVLGAVLCGDKSSPPK